MYDETEATRRAMLETGAPHVDLAIAQVPRDRDPAYFLPARWVMVFLGTWCPLLTELRR